MLNPTVEKMCSKCNVLKPATQFYRKNLSKSGLKVGSSLLIAASRYKQ